MILNWVECHNFKRGNETETRINDTKRGETNQHKSDSETNKTLHIYMK